MLMRAYNLITNRINRSLNIIGFTKQMVNFSKNTYIPDEPSINHLQSKINDKKSIHKNCKMFVVIVTLYKND